MEALTSESGCFAGRQRWSAGHFLCLLLCLIVLAVTPGCGGCRKTPEQIRAERAKREAERRAKERERKKKKKPDVQIGKLVSLPHGPNPDLCPYKQGHWTAATLPAKANNFNVLGDLELTVVGRDGKPMELVAMPYTSTGSRRVTLPKGQPKLFYSRFCVPGTGRDAFLHGQINARKGGRGAYGSSRLLKRMPSYQYHLVVLARWPLSYKFLEGLDSVEDPSALEGGSSERAYYRVQLIQADRRATLPLYALFWTSIAYVLWDDADPDALNPEQQLALVDWLHWGGQLIISGPESLDTLGNSFLAPYLPATSEGTRELVAADFEELNNWWGYEGRQGRRKLVPVEPWSGVKLRQAPQARGVPGTGRLLVERRVGRGRIVVSAFALDHPELTDWPGFDSLFNACLLGRPGREFLGDFDVQVTWAGAKVPDADGTFRPNKRAQLDPRLVCKLRYFTRDTGEKTLPAVEAAPMPYSVAGRGAGVGAFDETALGDGEIIFGPDVASWCDFNAVAGAARQSLRKAAQIEIPERTFVVWVVGAYLLVLVPFNWAVFRLLGRVEWAWVAAPVIALACTVVVIRLAQLDIGFARARTEITVVETQGDYPRAHVTRYTALYTSLATRYQFHFDDPGAQIQPFPRVAKPSDFVLLPGQGRTRIRYDYGYGRDLSMEGYRVRSNDTGLVHSEQMVDLGGGIALEQTPAGGDQLVNRTGFTLHGAGVVRIGGADEPEQRGPPRLGTRDPGPSGNPPVETAWVGTLEPGETALLRWSGARTEGGFWRDERSDSPVVATGGEHGQLSLQTLIELAEDRNGMHPGDVRLVGWFEDTVAGLRIKPSAPQSRRATLVVANLRYGHAGDPLPDANTAADVTRDPVRVFQDFSTRGALP